MKITNIKREYTGGGNYLWWLTTDDEQTKAIGFDGESYCGYSNCEFTGEAEDELWYIANETLLHVLIGSDSAKEVTKAIADAVAFREFSLSAEGKRIWVEILDEHCCKANPLEGHNRPCDSGAICDKCREQWIADIHNDRLKKAMAERGLS